MIVAERTFRTCHQVLSVENTEPLPDEPCTPDCRTCSELRVCLRNAQWFATIRGRADFSRVPIPYEKVPLWREVLS